MLTWTCVDPPRAYKPVEMAVIEPQDDPAFVPTNPCKHRKCAANILFENSQHPNMKDMEESHRNYELLRHKYNNTSRDCRTWCASTLGVM